MRNEMPLPPIDGVDDVILTGVDVSDDLDSLSHHIQAVILTPVRIIMMSGGHVIFTKVFEGVS